MMLMTIALTVNIRRDAKVLTLPFTDYFQGFEHVEAVQQLFGAQTNEVLQQLRIEFRSGRGYMGVATIPGRTRTPRPPLRLRGSPNRN
jgi:hypothetical protein